MKEHSGVLLIAAQVFMLTYLGDGLTKQPEDFDRDILGDTPARAVCDIIFGDEPLWNKTIFADALGLLVQQGIVQACNDEKGWHYKLIRKDVSDYKLL